MKRRFTFLLLPALLVAFSFLFFGTGAAHAMPHHFLGATGWCNEEGCDNAFQDAGSANCSVFQVVVNTQPMKDANGRTFATGYILNSYDSTNGTPCYAAWGAINWDSDLRSIDLSGNAWVGTLNTKVYSGFELTQGSTPWYSSRMLSGADLSGNTCVSVWWAGTVYYADGTHASFNIKMIGGGTSC